MKLCSLFLVGLVSASLLAACSSDKDGSSGSTTEQVTGAVKLRQLGSKDDFLTAIRNGLITQNVSRGEPAEGSGDELLEVSNGETADTASPAEGSGAEGDVSATNVTSTNVQERGVDEQDWVKVSLNGSYLYVLDSQAYGDIGSFGIASVVDGVLEAGEPGDAVSELPLALEQPRSTLRILALDDQAPDATSLNEVTLSLEGRHAEGFYLYQTDSRSDVIVSASGGGHWGYWSEPAWFGGRDSLITRVDVSDAESAVETARMQLDGQIVSSRRIGQYLFLATRFYPQVADAEPYNMTPEQWRETVLNTADEDLLPHYRTNDAEQRRALIDPGNCFVTDTAITDDYTSPDVITLSVLDLESWQLSDSQCFLGASETLYASPNAVFLATTRYDYSVGPVNESGIVIDIDDGEFPGDMIWYDPRIDTDIHQFSIDGGQLVYAGSGTVAGHLGWNALRKPFRMSERNGYLRIATFNDRQGPDTSPILLHVLQADGTGELRQIATLPNETRTQNIGKPGERLYASRFLGERAYLVTFRQTDPLYIIDLQDPRQPYIAGELEIEGFSDYLHPVDDAYLLGIGMDAVAAPDGGRGDGRGALVQGVKLSLFNVSNPAAPTEVQSLLVGERGTSSRALNDHRAITIQPATSEHPMRVAFGIDVHGEPFPTSSPEGSTARDYHRWNLSGLHGFEIRTGADAGILSRGVLVARTSNGNESFSDYADDRSVFVNDALFYVRGNRVYAAPWDDLSTPSPAR